jgi:hypothetical protein
MRVEHDRVRVVRFEPAEARRDVGHDHEFEIAGRRDAAESPFALCVGIRERQHVPRAGHRRSAS